MLLLLLAGSRASIAACNSPFYIFAGASTRDFDPLMFAVATLTERVKCNEYDARHVRDVGDFTLSTHHQQSKSIAPTFYTGACLYVYLILSIKVFEPSQA